jgi:hypothetical protein
MPRTIRSHRLAAVPALAVAPVLAAAALAAAAPASADPTLRVDQPCYSPGDVIAIQGEGYTPSAPVDVSLTGASVATESFGADLTGLLRAQFDLGYADAEALVPRDELQQEVTLAALDRTVAQAGDGRVAGAATRFLISRFATYISQDPEAIRPARPLTVWVAGMTADIGRTLYLHYVRGGNRRATQRFGVLEGPCGDARRKLAHAFPFAGVQPGPWTLVLNLSKTDASRRPRLTFPIHVER